MSEEVWKILSVLITCSIKFSIAGIPLAIFYGFSFLKSFIVTSSGGIIGVIFFTFISQQIIKTSKKLLKKNTTHKKKIFTRTNKTIVWVKNKMGLTGLSILAPTLLSIPLGAFLAVRYYKNTTKIILYMSLSVMLCSFLLLSYKLFF